MFFFSSRRRHTRYWRDWSSDVCSSDLEELRGTYTGLAHPVMIEHLKTLGVTAVELMPVHEFLNDHHLQEKGLSNYWGYNTRSEERRVGKECRSRWSPYH